jgi:acyl-homoserine-lactone acylase
MYDGKERQMTASTITLPVLQADGSLKDVTRTYYSSHYGPILSMPGIGWTENTAITYRDTNLNNEAFVAQYLAMARSTSLAEFKQSIDTVQGLPWVHTMAADAEGNVWYADAAPTPNLSTDTYQAWQKEVARAGSLPALLRGSNMIVLDGSTSRDEWVVEAGSRSPGLIPTSKTARLSRKDVVFNSNESYWFVNPSVTLEGFSLVQGDQRTPRSLRTRMNALMLSEVREGGASGADGRFNMEEMQETILSNRSLSAELLREAVVERCKAQPSGTVQGQTVDLSAACAVLASWNGRFGLNDAGAPLWREFIDTFGPAAQANAGPLFANGFSPSAPLTTPNTLTPAPATGPDPILNQLAAAVLTLRKAGIEVTMPLGQVQYAIRGGERVAVHGGLGQDGVSNVVNYLATLNSTLEPATPRSAVLNARTGLTDQGYVLNSGTSFLMATEFVEGGIRARAVLTLGQQGDAAALNYRDQLSLFSEKQWRDVAFTEEEIRNAPDYRRISLRHD